MVVTVEIKFYVLKGGNRSQWPAARSTAWVCGRPAARPPAEIKGSNPTGAWMSVVSVVCFQVEVSATG